jgi:lipid-A-disaccharide synthase
VIIDSPDFTHRVARRVRAAAPDIPIIDYVSPSVWAWRPGRAALAKSGTVTLELALAGVPMAAAYKVSALEAFVARRMIRVPSVILANLVLGENIVPEFLQEDCTPDALAAALAPLLADTPERRRQTEAFARLDAIMRIGEARPSEEAARVVIEMAKNRGNRRVG